jgi:hypothetical protein
MHVTVPQRDAELRMCPGSACADIVPDPVSQSSEDLEEENRGHMLSC